MNSDPESFQDLSAAEIELLRAFRTNEDIAIIHPRIDSPAEVTYIAITSEKGNIIRMNNEEMLEKVRAINFLKSYIAVERGVKPEEITSDYIDKMLEESYAEAELTVPTKASKFPQRTPKP